MGPLFCSHDYRFTCEGSKDDWSTENAMSGRIQRNGPHDQPRACGPVSLVYLNHTQFQIIS